MITMVEMGVALVSFVVGVVCLREFQCPKCCLYLT